MLKTVLPSTCNGLLLAFKPVVTSTTLYTSWRMPALESMSIKALYKQQQVQVKKAVKLTML